MRYLPQTREDIDRMLQVVGIDSLDGLCSGIPEDCRRKEELDLPEPNLGLYDAACQSDPDADAAEDKTGEPHEPDQEPPKPEEAQDDAG